MSIAEKLTTIAENMQKVYDAGKAAADDSGGYEEGYSQAESDFWDALTDNGNRVFYEYAFSRSGFEYIRPQHKIVPTSRSIGMFSFSQNLKKIEKQYFDLSKCQITTQSAGTGGHYSPFYSCTDLEVFEDVGLQPGGYYLTWNSCHKLHTIEVMRVLETTKFEAPFSGCYALENLTIEGTIGQNGFVVKYSPLSHDSLMSIITALKDYSTDTSGTQWVVTLGTENLNKLTDAEKAIATQKGWTLA